MGEPLAGPRLSALAALAREAVQRHLRGEAFTPPALGAPFDVARSVFVSVWGPGGRLRGCIGHLEPTTDSLSEEVALCAVLAATRDPRCAPLRAAELPDCTFEVSVLHSAEPVSDLSGLDPMRYGVVVSQGERRGVLLAGVPGVRDAAHQVQVARQKAGIPPGADVAIQRFFMEKVRG